MRAVYKKELSSFFRSMTGYVLIAFLVTFTGVYFMIYNLSQGYPYFSYTLSSIMLVLLVLVPVLTMRSFAEERKSKTDQLLFSSHFSDRSLYWRLLLLVFFPKACHIIQYHGKIILGVFNIRVPYNQIQVFFLVKKDRSRLVFQCSGGLCVHSPAQSFD